MIRRVIQHGATATAIAIAALIIAIVALFSSRGGSGSDGALAPASVADLRQPAITMGYVQRAMDFYDSQGREATLSHYNSPASVEGENYLFVLDGSGELVVHINPDLLGGNVHTNLGIDADGNRFGVLMLEATSAGMWLDYVYENPTTGFRELKHTWIVRHDGLFFGSGWYEFQRPSVIEFVENRPRPGTFWRDHWEPTAQERA